MGQIKQMAVCDVPLPIILSQRFDGRLEDDTWLYFQQMNENSTTYVKWNGQVTTDSISEGKGNRQGGISSAEEWKIFNNCKNWNFILL